MTKLNWEKMVREINELVTTDFCFDMEIRSLQSQRYTQAEAQKMSKILEKIYAIAHCCDCGACGREYLKK